jgi:chromosome segregation ATPase
MVDDEHMDPETASRVSQLAKNLKDLHLATSAEEAYARAKEIIMGTATQGQEKSIKELMQEAGVTQQDLQKAKELLAQEEDELNKLKKELTELKAKQLEETMHHGEHVNETEKLDEELIDEEHDIGVVEENIEAAEEVQEEKKEEQPKDE